jgi:hypothetical protein
MSFAVYSTVVCNKFELCQNAAHVNSVYFKLRSREGKVQIEGRMERFDQYEMELNHKIAVIRQRINQLGSFQGGTLLMLSYLQMQEKKKVVITETEIQLESVREIVSND